MLIANPIYDSVFKYLMEDLRAARALLSGILGETVEVLQFCPQENANDLNPYKVTIYRLDFKAVIVGPGGQRRKVLIEMQKAKEHFDIMRFRHYLGDNYSRAEVVNGKQEVLPIVTIYFLGFNLGLEVPVLHVGRTYINAATGSVIQGQDDFVEHLTHDSYVVQIPRLPIHAKNKMEQLLSVFSQKWSKDGDKEWTMQYLPDSAQESNEDLRLLLSRLSEGAGDDRVRGAVRIEKELERTVFKKIRELERDHVEKDKALEEQGKALEEKDKALEEQVKALEEQANALEEQANALAAERQSREALEKRLAELLGKIAE